jgi:predicted DNA-binding transcriptional regulator AlpA
MQNMDTTTAKPTQTVKSEPTIDPLITSADFMRRFSKLSPATFWRWYHDGRLPPVNKIIGRRYFWHQSVVDAWINTPSTSAPKRAA